MPPRKLRGLCLAWAAVGIAVLTAATLLFPVSPSIGLPFAALGDLAIPTGLALWVVIALVASSLGYDDGQGARFVLTSGPLAAAAMLGGPAAVAWVAALGTIELRELRGDVPWYGVLATHAHLTIAWTAAGLVLWAIGFNSLPAALPLGSLLVMLLIGLLADGLAALLAGSLVAARRGIPLRDMSPADLRPGLLAIIADVALGWLITWAYTGLAWWSPFIFVVVDAAAVSSLAAHRLAWDIRHDRLTLLPNRLALAEHVQRLERRKDGGGLAVFFIDLDRFKSVNDDHGHHVGDRVLLAVAQRLAGVCRADDFLAHLHGDEFVMVARGVSTDHDARAIVDRVTEAMGPPIDHEGKALSVGATVGYALAEPGASFEAQLRRADRAMSASKDAQAAMAGGRRR
jgi:diguanylate cyclase (GGDEF)-like protein